MRLENPDTDKIQILINPIENHGLYSSHNRFLYYLSLFILKTGVPCKNKRLVRSLILGTFAKVVEAAKLEADKIAAAPIGKVTVRKSTHADSDNPARNAMNRIRQHFAVRVFLEDPECEQVADLVRRYIETCQLSTYEYTNSRVSEKLNLNFDDQELLPDYPNLWLAFYFSELLYFLLTDEFEARIARRKIYLYPNPEREFAFRRHWLAETSEFTSTLSDLVTLKSKDHFIRYPYITLENSADVVEKLLDKVFSLQSHMLSEELQQSRDFKTLKEIVLFAACVECVSYLDNDIPESFFRRRTSIRDETINKLITALQRRRTNRSISALKGFVVYEDRFFKRGTQKFKFGLKRLAGTVLQESLTELKDPKGDIGKSFEADYILNYLKGLNYFGYEAHGELKPAPAARIKGYDIDLVLKNTKENLFLFIQVKYWFSNLPVYLDEQIRFFNSDKVQDAVVRQLITLKENIENAEIRERLLACGLADARKENSYFILLHNVPFLNFYELSGVIFYEWNVFRNLLQQGRVFVQEFEGGREKSLSHVNAVEKVPVHRPTELIDSYLARDDVVGQSVMANWSLHNRALSYFALDGVSFAVRAF
jgi:hypothetical protein